MELVGTNVTDRKASFLPVNGHLYCPFACTIARPISASALPRICRETASHLTETSRHRLLPSKYLCISREKGRSE